MYPSFINLHEDENDHLLLDMDSLIPKRSNFLASRGCESAKKKCSLGNAYRKKSVSIKKKEQICLFLSNFFSSSLNQYLN